VESIQLPQYCHPDAPRQIPLVEQASLGSQPAHAADVVWLHGMCPVAAVVPSG